MAGGYTAGIARITIRPDLKGFKKELENEIQKHLKDYRLEVKPDRENFRKDIDSLIDDAKKRLGPLADGINIGVDEKSKRQALKDLHQIEKAKEKADAAEKARRSAAAKQAAKTRRYNKSMANSDGFTATNRQLGRSYARVERHIKNLGVLATRTSRNIADSTLKQAKAVDRLANSEKRAITATENGLESLNRARRALAQVESKDKPTKHEHENAAAALRTAQRNYNELVNAQRQATLDLKRGRKELTTMLVGLDESMKAPGDALQSRIDAAQNIARLKNAIRGVYHGRNRETAGKDVKDALAWSKREKDPYAVKVGTEVIRQAGKLDNALKVQAQRYRDLEDATKAAEIAQIDYNKTFEDFADDKSKTARATETDRRARQRLQVAKDAALEADVEVQKTRSQLADAENAFNDAITVRPAALAQFRRAAAQNIATIKTIIAQDVRDGSNELAARAYALQRYHKRDLGDIKDDNAIKFTERLIQAGQRLDQANTAKLRSTAELARATRDLEDAEVNLHATERDFADDEERLIQAHNRLADARERLTNAARNDVDADIRVARDTDRYDSAKNDVNKHSGVNIFTRMARGADRILSKAFDTMGSKVILVGRYISAVMQIATTATMVLAGMGAVNLVPLIGALSSVASTLTLLPALATSAAAAIAAIVIGGNGIAEAFQAATKMSKNSDKDSKAQQREIEQAAKAQANAEDQYERAVESVTDAHERREDAIRDVQDAQKDAQRTAIDGARQIREAEEQVVDAKKAAKDAERDLARARKDAARDVRDLNDALNEGSLSEEEAALGIQRARERILETRRDPKATRTDRWEAELGLKRAVQNQQNVRKRNAELREEAAKANAVGIEGSDGVVAAKENLANAREGVRDAQQNVVDTRDDAARANEDAARRVADARRSVRDADRGIRDANKAVADAAQAMADASKKLSEAQSGIDSTAVDEFERAMGRLSPSARKFVETARELGDEWSDLRLLVQENLFDGLDQSLLQLAGDLPILKTGLGDIATTINYGLRSAITALTTDASKLDFAKTLGNTTIATHELSKAATPLAYAWRDLATVGSEFLPALATGLREALQGFSGKIDEMRKDGSLAALIQNALDKTYQFGQVIGNVFGGLKGIFSATKPLGDDMLESLVLITERFQRWTESEEGRKRILEFFTNAKTALREAWDLVTQFASAFMNSVVPAVQNMSVIVEPLLKNILFVLDEYSGTIKWVITAFLGMRVIGGTITAIKLLMDGLRTATVYSGVVALETRDKFRNAMTQIQSSAATANTRVGGAFKGMGTALGLFMTALGPAMLGAAIAVGIGFLINLVDQKRKAKEATEALEQAEKNYQATLDKRSGLATKQSLETFIDSVQSDAEGPFAGALDRVRGFGIEETDYTSAAVGNEAAIGRVRGRLMPEIRRGVEASGPWNNSRGRAAFESAGIDADLIARALANEGTAMEEYDAKIAEYKRRNQGNSDAYELGGLDWMIDKLPDDTSESAARILIPMNRNIQNGLEGAKLAQQATDAINGELEKTTALTNLASELGMEFVELNGAHEAVLQGDGSQAQRDRIDALRKRGYNIDTETMANNMVIIDSSGADPETQQRLPELGWVPGKGGTDPTIAAPAPELKTEGEPAPVEINPDAIVYEDVEMPEATVEAPELNVEGQDVPGAVTDVPKVDYAPALGAFKTYGEHIADIFKEKIEPSLMRMIELQDRIGPSMRESADVGIPAMDELGETTGRLNESFKLNITEGALVEWDKLLPGIGLDIFDLQTKQFPMLMTALTTLKESFRIAVVGISEEFLKIRRAVAEPLNWVIVNALGGLKNAWNNVREVIPSLKEWNVTATPIAGYHTGGIMSGYSPGVDDRIIAVGGGEAIMRPEFTRAMGASWINEMNAAARSGGVAGVNKLREKWAGAYNRGGIVQAMTDAVKEKFPMMDMTSGLRFTDDGYHSKGMAADFSNAGVEGSPEMRSLAGWIADNFPPGKTLQLIHRPFNRNIGQGVGWVGDGVGFYGEGTMEDHRHHVHWATDQLVSADGTSAPAPVGADGGFFSAAASKAVIEKFTAPVDAMRKSMPDFGPSLMGGVLPTTVVDAIISAAKNAVGKSRGPLDSGTTPWDISAGVEQWDANIRAALAREGFEVNERNVQLTKMQMQTESGGNPNIVQQVQDVNSGGNEAVGAMQVTPGTFATFRNPDLPNDRTNVDASLSAALRWYRHKYGEDLGVMWGKGHGYDQGGWLKDGEFGVNQSGKPEPVFTNSQWGLISDLIANLAKLAPIFDLGLGLPVQVIDFGKKALDKFVEGLGRAPLTATPADDSSTASAATTTDTSTDESGSDPLLDYQGPLPPVTDPELTGSERDQALNQAIQRRDAAEAEIKKAEQEQAVAIAALMQAQQNGQVSAEVLAESQKQIELAKKKLQAAQTELDRANADVDKATKGQKISGGLNVPLSPGTYGGENYVTPSGTAAPADGDSYGSDPAIDPKLLAESDSYFAEGGDYRNTDPAVEAGGSILDGYPQRIADAGINFLKANYDQFKADLGYNRPGMLSNLFSEGRKLWDEYASPAIAEQIHYHVTDIDEAMRKERVRQQQMAKTYIRR